MAHWSVIAGSEAQHRFLVADCIILIGFYRTGNRLKVKSRNRILTIVRRGIRVCNTEWNLPIVRLTKISCIRSVVSSGVFWSIFIQFCWDLWFLLTGCESGMFIPNLPKEMKEKKFCVLPFFVATSIIKLLIILFLKRYRNFFSQNT